MAQDDNNKEDKFDFTADGEALGYISLAQARLLSMQTAREIPGNYGDRFSNVPMVFAIIESGEDEDYYNVILDIRPSGHFAGSPGREQFFISKEGEVALRQVLNPPSSRGGWPLPIVVAGVAAVLGMVAIVGVVFASSGGDNLPVATTLTTDTPVPTTTAVPAGIDSTNFLVPAPTSTSVTTPVVVFPASGIRPTAAVPVIVPTATPMPVATPTPPTGVYEDAAPPSGSVEFRDHYYLTVPQRMTWVEAVAFSKSLGGHLVTISDMEENRFVADLGQTMYDGWVKHNSFWIGLTDEAQEGRFLWVTGESSSYTNWSGTEPNNAGNEDYVTIGQNSRDTWNDHPSKDIRPFVVEFESRSAVPGIVPTATPMPVATPTPPTGVYEDAAPPSGSVAFRDHYYLTVPQRMTWVEAVAYSESLGGHLVTISDMEENRFVADLGQTMYDGWVKHNSFWIGLTDEAQEGRFLWLTGESISYTNWSGTEPNNSGNEDYVTIGQNSRDTWNDHPSTDLRPFVVEFEP